MEHEEVKNRAIRGVVALVSRTMVLQVINGVALFFLGIFLSPTAIGVYIVVSAAIRIFTLFTDVGLGAALVQKKNELDEEDLKVAFTIQEVLVLTVVAASFLTTPIVAARAGLDPEGIFLYHILAVVLFISSLKVIPSILLERKLHFEKQVIPQILEAVVFNIVVVSLAFKGWGVRSYSWAALLSALSSLPVYYWLSPWRVSLGFSKAKADELFSYGLAYQGKSFLAVIKDDLLTLFLSGLPGIGTSGIGYWGTAQRWAYFPYRFVVDSVTKVTFPAYSRIRENENLLRKSIEKSLFAVSTILFPIYTMLIIMAGKLIYLIPKYTKWEPSLPSLYFLCATALIAGLTNILVNVLDATGRVKTTLGLMVMWIIATWVITILAVSRLGFTGIAVAAFLVSLTIFVVIYLVKKVVAFNFLSNIFRQFLAAAVMGLTVFGIISRLPNNFLVLIAAGAVGGIIYLVLLFALAGGELIANTRSLLKAYRPEKYADSRNFYS